MKIDAQTLRDLIFEDHGPEWTVIEDEITGRWRWGVEKRIIVKYEDQFYGYDYRVETSHDEYRIVDADDNIEVELWKAIPVPVNKIEWKEAKDDK